MGRTTMMTWDEVERQHCDACNHEFMMCECEHGTGESAEALKARADELFARCEKLRTEAQEHLRTARRTEEGVYVDREYLRANHIEKTDAMRRWSSVMSAIHGKLDT